MKSLSAISGDLARHKGDKLTVGEVMRQGGSRAHGLGLLLFALPEAIPIPVPSLSTVLAVPLILISGHLILFGEDKGIPRKVRDQSVPKALFEKIDKYVAPVVRRLERVTQPRWEALAGQVRLLGAACLLLAIILLLPIPFGNLLPALCLAAIAFGMIQRDGVVVALGLLGGLACTGAALYAASMAVSIFG